MQGAVEGPAVLPLGQNCHLGMALSRFAYHDASLFRWADIAMSPLLAFLEGDSDEPFAGRTEFRMVGTAFGTMRHAAMRARLAEANESARINSIVFNGEGDAYAHGVQLTRAEAAGWSYAEICAANAAKFKHLREKWIADLGRACAGGDSSGAGANRRRSGSRRLRGGSAKGQSRRDVESRRSRREPRRRA